MTEVHPGWWCYDCDVAMVLRTGPGRTFTRPVPDHIPTLECPSCDTVLMILQDLEEMEELEDE